MGKSETMVRDLFIAAASECGDDVQAIVSFVESRLAEMSESEREDALAIGRKVLDYRAPPQRPDRSQ